MNSRVEEREGAAHGPGHDGLSRVVVASLLVLIVAGLALAAVFAVKDRSNRSRQPVGQSSVSTTDQTPRAGTSSTPPPGKTAAPAMDAAEVAASVDPWVVELTVKRAGGATDMGTGIVLTSDG